MSTWISSRAALAGAALLLAACDGLGLGGDGTVESIDVAGGAVTIAGPRGYCIDTEATQDGDAPVVFLGSCAALEQSPDAPRPDRSAVLTASVLETGTQMPPIGDALDELADFLASEPGRAALSRDGNADSVEVLETGEREGVLFVRLTDESAFDGPEIAPDYRRAIFELGGHIVSLSALSPAAHPLDDSGREVTLEAFVRAVMAANADGSAS